jgi:7-cyano-7-deazaguanine synthase
VDAASDLPPHSAGDPDSVIALVSGGLDSCLMVWRALAAGAHVHPLYVRLGTVWQAREEQAARRFLEALPAHERGTLRRLTVLTLRFPPDYPRRWAVDAAVAPPDSQAPDCAVDLPGKNLAVLTKAANLAQSVGAGRIQLGVLDTNPFADAQADFLDRFAASYRVATGHGVRIERPLAGFAKAVLMREGRALPLGLTFSCLRPRGDRHCGRCNKCGERRRAFADSGIADPTAYENEE